MPELKEILHRLKLGQSKRTIQKETGTHRTIIREMERLAAMHGWFQSDTLPEEEEIMRVRDGQMGHALHPLDLYREYIKGLVDREVSYTVIHRLIKEKHPCDESTVRRYIKRTFPETISPVIRRLAEPGIMEVDFGYLGMAIDDLTGKKVKALSGWLFLNTVMRIPVLIAGVKKAVTENETLSGKWVPMRARDV